jgi:hypothetical protein
LHENEYRRAQFCRFISQKGTHMPATGWKESEL